MYSSRGPLHPPPGSGQRRAWWCGAENVPAILELFQSFHLHSCSTILLLGPSIFFSQGLTCSNLKGLMLTAKQPEIALHGATYSSVSSQLLPTVVSCVIPAGRRYCKNLSTPHRRGKLPEVFLNLLYWIPLLEIPLELSHPAHVKFTAEFTEVPSEMYCRVKL